MKYMGSKNRIAKDILPIILKDRISEEQYYIEPFCGGCNLIDKVIGNRIASDINPYLIAMWEHLIFGDLQPFKVSKDEYNHIKDNKDLYKKEIIGWVGFNCSYSGKFFGGYAGETKTKIGTIRDYQIEAINNIEKQIPSLKGIDFFNISYDKLDIPNNSIIYCDIPYKDTTKYNTNTFDYDNFYNWCKYMKKQGHQIFISEYNMPDDFICVWQKEVKSSLSANGQTGGNKISIEKLFTI